MTEHPIARAHRAHHPRRRSDPAVPGRSGRRGRPPGQARARRSTPSCRGTTTPSRCRSCSARRWRSPRCSAPRSNSKASSSCRPRPTVRSICSSPIIRCRAACAAMRASRPSGRGRACHADGRLLGQGHFAMTIDRGADTERYQGVVPLEGESLTEAARHLFPPVGAASHLHPPRRGEALPRRQRRRPVLDLARRRAAGAEADARGRPLAPRRSGFRRGGLDARQGACRDRRGSRAARSAASARPAALPAVPRGAGARLSRHQLETYCSCSRERVEELLQALLRGRFTDMVVDGEVWVTCEFCNSRYRFDPASFADA